MPKLPKSNLGSLRRRFTTLLTALTFIVLAVSGVLAFVRPFSLRIVGLHALIGFLVTLLIGLHVANNVRPLKGYLRSRAVWVTLAITAILTGILLLQPRPVKNLLALSNNLGPSMERFEMNDNGMVFHYSPAPHYKIALTIRTGKSFDPENPPHIAIWLENQSFYHIKTLLDCTEKDCTKQLPYWTYYVAEYKKAKQKAELGIEIDAVSSATQNSSFDPADYILPADSKNPMSYRLLVEINQANDPFESINDQASLLYAVEIDNLHPKSFQLLDLIGFPKKEINEGKTDWATYFVDEGFGSALELIDSGLLTIARKLP